MSAEKNVDVHVHLAALPTDQNGCWISRKMRTSSLTRIVLWRMGVSAKNPEQVNEAYLARLVKRLRESKYVKQAVLLALDGYYDAQGNLDRTKTAFLISNDYMFSVVKRYPDLFLPGCSVNPHRKDALEELERCAGLGAVLVKVLPNSQGFDPANLAYLPYYKALANHKMALLCHVGAEFSVSSGHQNFGDPSKLRVALDQGVTVIAAHGMSHGMFFGEPYLKLMQEFVKAYPNFYWDASALTLPNRVGMLLQIRKHPDLWPRMKFGTDYPLPSYAFPAILGGEWRGYWELKRTKNPFDRAWRLLEILGIRNT